MPWVLDLDGVVWLGPEVVPGAAEAVTLLRAAGESVVFVTNNAATPVATQEAKLASFGIEAEGDLVSSAQAAATLVDPSERVLVIGEAGLLDEVRKRGATVVTAGDAADDSFDDGIDVVVSGLDRSFGFETLRRAGRAIRAGARWVQTNPDTTFPTPTGLDPGAGALAAAIEAVAGRPPDAIGGKPDGAIIGLLHARLGSEGVVVGDRADTDGRFAVALGYRFGLVLSGVTKQDDLPVDPEPWRIAPDLLTFVRAVLD